MTRQGSGGEGSAIKLEHVTKSFDDHKVLDDVSIDVEDGSAFCLLGRSGTGKSVTLKHIIGLLRPDAGRVFVRGKDVAALSGRELSDVRRSMGFLFQNAALFDSITVGENGNAPDWRGRWRSTPTFCSSTSRAPASIPSRRARSTTCSSSARRAARRLSSSPTTSRARGTSATSSRCCTTGASSRAARRRSSTKATTRSFEPS
ncbi:MAG: hypothetical protein DMF87_08885 [Acidobacteria bacterium]|nr:MAG: hypothetical protein DMF87_08885 [Acidobacteriota bacterium]